MNKCTIMFLVLLCLLGTWQSSFAQTELSFEEEVALVTAPLDVGDLQTGFLIDRSVGYRALDLFDGITDIDSFNFTATHFLTLTHFNPYLSVFTLNSILNISHYSFNYFGFQCINKINLT